jgi:hypothetical protein
MSVFFLDRCIPPQMAKLIEAFDRESTVYHHNDYFSQITTDEQWISTLMSWNPKPVVISGDGRILTNRAELAVLQGAGLSFVELAPGWTKLAWRDQAIKMLQVWGQIVAVSVPQQPTVYKVPISAKKVEKISILTELSKGPKKRR